MPARMRLAIDHEEQSGDRLYAVHTGRRRRADPPLSAPNKTARSLLPSGPS
jgi:hypothetical protein